MEYWWTSELRPDLSRPEIHPECRWAVCQDYPEHWAELHTGLFVVLCYKAPVCTGWWRSCKIPKKELKTLIVIFAVHLLKLSYFMQGFFTLTTYACIFCIEKHFQRSYLGCSKAGKFFENAMQFKVWIVIMSIKLYSTITKLQKINIFFTYHKKVTKFLTF